MLYTTIDSGKPNSIEGSSEKASASAGDSEILPPKELQSATPNDTKPNAKENGDFHPIMTRATEPTLQILRPWIDQFLAKRQPGGPIVAYEIVKFDNDYLEKVRHGEQPTFVFNFNDRYTFDVSIDEIMEGKSFWIANGYVPDRPDGSSARLFILEDGSMEGGLQIVGEGGFYIQATPDLPHHIVFLLSGIYEID